MRFMKSLVLAALALTTSAQTAWAGPEEVTFRFTSFGLSVAGLPANAVGPYEGSINGGISSFDVYCVGAINFAASAGTDFSAWQTRLGSDPLDRTRLQTLGTAAGAPAFAADGYMYMAYIANRIRLGDYATDSQRAAAQLAIWYFSMDSPTGGLLLASETDPILGQLTSGLIHDRLSEEVPFLDCTGAQYDFCTIAQDALDNAATQTANWRWNDWVVYSDARWTDPENLCWSRTENTGYADLIQQDCIQEAIAYDVIPEPATMSLLGIGLVGLSIAGFRRRRNTA